jgi:uncharacterized protein YegL
MAPIQAQNPSPPDGARDVLVPLLTWESGGDVVCYNVYLGTSPILTEADLVAACVPAPIYLHPPGLEPGVTYYWRIDAVLVDGTVVQGDIWSFTAGPGPEPVPGEIVLTFEAGDYEIEQDEQGNDTIVMGGFGYTSSPGDPRLPCRSYDVVVPPDIDWDTLELEVTPEAALLPGPYTIEPAPPFYLRIEGEDLNYWGVDKEILDGRNIRVYDVEAFYPPDCVSISSQSQMRKWRFLRLEFTPVQYNPVTGELVLVSSVEVRLTFLRIGGQEYRTDPLLGDTLMDDEARERFINFDEAQEWYEYVPDPNSIRIANGSGKTDYAIITTKAIANSGKLNAFVNHKKGLGHTVGVYTEDNYGSVTGQAPNGTAEKIRKWLKDNYAENKLGIKWVLLIGDPDPDDPGNASDSVGDVPMKMCRPNHGQAKFDFLCPTDHFYADLTGDWDQDGDEIYGERYAGDAGGVDFTPEVLVGRIPVYAADYVSLDHILKKVIAYEKAAHIPDWRRRVLLPMPPVEPKAHGYDVGELIKDDLIDPAGLTCYRLYDHASAPSPNPGLGIAKCTQANVVAEWKKGYGLVTWCAHGSATSASGKNLSSLYFFPIFKVGSCAQLNDGTPAYTLQAACSNGRPDVSGNLQYELLKHGAVGTVGASTYSMGADAKYKSMPPTGTAYQGTNQHFAYFYTKHFLGGMTTGQALLLKTKDFSKCWVNNMIYNIYGDPTGSLYRPYAVAKHVDVVPVLDTSGSMQGYTSSSLTEQKITTLKKAAKHFTYMLDRNVGHQMGLVTFSTKASTSMKLQPFNTASRSFAHGAIAGLSATGMTSIGDGLDHAVTEFAQTGKAANRRVVLLVTDGMENTSPMIKDVEGKIVTAKTAVYALGLGYSYGLDAARLAALANKTKGDYRVTHDSLIYHKFYLEMLGAAAAGNTVAADPIFELNYGQSEFVPVTIGTDEEQAIFTAYWLDVDHAIALTVYSPAGDVYDASVPEYAGEEHYCLYKIDLSNLPLEHRAGEWIMEIRSVADAPVRVSASAFVRPGPTLAVELDPFSLRTGTPLYVSAHLENKGLPVVGAYVVANYDKPLVGFGSTMNEFDVDMDDVNEPAPGGDAMNPIQQKTAYLQRDLGDGFMPRDTGVIQLFDDGTHGDVQADDGVYTNIYDDTAIPGSYTFHVMASDIPCGEGLTTTREWTKSLHCEVDIDPDYSDISISQSGTTTEAAHYAVEVAPRDMFGNYLGPGHDIAVRVSYPGGGREIELADGMNGVYVKEISVRHEEVQAGAELRIYVDGTFFFAFAGL